MQSILFDNSKYTPTTARRWLKKHNYKPIKHVDKTKNYLRYRLKPPRKSYKYRTIKLGDNIKAVYIVPKS